MTPNGPSERAVAQQHPGDDRVVRPPPGLDRARDGEAGAAVLEHDARARRDEARAEAHVVRLDERDGHAVAVDGAEVDGAAGRLGDGGARLRRRRSRYAGVEQVGDVGAVAHARKRVLERELHAADLRRRGSARSARAGRAPSSAATPCVGGGSSSTCGRGTRCESGSTQRGLVGREILLLEPGRPTRSPRATSPS